MNLRVEIVDRKNKDIKRIKTIYKTSFPKEERMPFWLMRIMAKITSTEFLSFHDNDTLCGFVYMATMDNLTFIMFLAVDENLRSYGYGSAILNEIQAMYKDNKIITYIDIIDETAEDNDQRLRRKKFYMANGYEETEYLVNSTNDIIQEIIIKNGEFEKGEFMQFFKKYSKGAMKPKIFKK